MQGDFIGQYAFLLESGFYFEAIAGQDTSVFVLNRSSIEKNIAKIKGLDKALSFGVELI